MTSSGDNKQQRDQQQRDQQQRQQQQGQMPANDDGRTDDRGVAEVESGRQGSQAMQGEGNYEAARRYDEAQQDFVESGKVDLAARAASPRSKTEQEDMSEAERKGKQRAKE